MKGGGVLGGYHMYVCSCILVYSYTHIYIYIHLYIYIYITRDVDPKDSLFYKNSWHFAKDSPEPWRRKRFPHPSWRSMTSQAGLLGFILEVLGQEVLGSFGLRLFRWGSEGPSFWLRACS